VNKSSEAFLVPAISVLSGLEERYVFVSKEGKASRVLIRTGARTANHVQVIDGIKTGDIVLTSGVQQMRPGLPIEVALASPTP
jgi:membrane fusion protein (multidrug efflux system)